MSEFKIYCRCGQHILLDETYIGEVIECPTCHGDVLVERELPASVPSPVVKPPVSEPGPAVAPREMKPIDVEEAVLKGVDLYKSNFGLVLGAVLLSFLVGGFTLGICYGPMFVGLFALLARLAKKPDPKPDFGDVGDIFKGLNRFLPSFMLMLVTGVAVLATMALFFVLFIVTMRVYQFFPVFGMIPFVGLWLVLALLVILVFGPVQMWSLMLLANTDMTWQEAVAFVVKSTFGKKAIRPITLGVVATFVGGVGVLFCGLGSALTLPLMFCIYAAAYEQAFGKAPEKPALPGAVA